MAADFNNRRMQRVNGEFDASFRSHYARDQSDGIVDRRASSLGPSSGTRIVRRFPQFIFTALFEVAFNGVLVGLRWPAIFWTGYTGTGTVP